MEKHFNEGGAHHTSILWHSMFEITGQWNGTLAKVIPPCRTGSVPTHVEMSCGVAEVTR